MSSLTGGAAGPHPAGSQFDSDLIDHGVRTQEARGQAVNLVLTGAVPVVRPISAMHPEGRESHKLNGAGSIPAFATAVE